MASAFFITIMGAAVPGTKKTGRLTGAPRNRSKVRDWIESTLIDHLGNSKDAARGASRSAQRYAIELIADKELSKRYRDYRLSEEPA